MAKAPATSEKKGAQRSVAVAIGLLLCLSIPWYFPSGDGRPFVFGVPLWCAVAFSCYCAIAAIVVVAMPLIWDEASVEEEEGRRE